MRAIILNSGLGKRMGDLTVDRPKCLINLIDETILGRQLRLLRQNNIRQITITTGFHENKITEFCKEHFKDLSIEYVNNIHYMDTNYIYSMHLLGTEFSDNVLLLHGDLVFDENILERIISAPQSNCAYIKMDNTNVSIKDFKALIDGDKIKRISTELNGKNVYDFFPIYKFSRDDFNVWLAEIQDFISKKRVHVYAEEALNNVLDMIFLEYLYVEGDLLTEIDDINDLKKARSIL